MIDSYIFRSTFVWGWFLAMAVYSQSSSLAQPATKDQDMFGKVYVGYQGWFNAEGDGMGLGFRHYSRDGLFKPGYSAVEMWPDLSEFDDDEKYSTAFKHADGSVANVFSSANGKTVDRHFGWMRQYGIDGAFLQRFGTVLRDPVIRKNRNTVLAHVRNAARNHQRQWALMYDLSGLKEGEIRKIVIEDFKLLADAGIRDDLTYIHYKGKPVVAVWGIGFNDGRSYTLTECAELVDFLQNDPSYGGNAVLAGVPYNWRRLQGDSIRDPAFHNLLRTVDILSPWAVGRYRSRRDIDYHEQYTLKPDVEWTSRHHVGYIPVAFPGFSWHNLKSGPGRDVPIDEIPRQGGQFLWDQAVSAQRAGADMLYIAMFDEIDEATAIFKVTNDPPVGKTPFLTYQGLPSDHYLWLAGQIGKLYRGQLQPAPNVPTRPVNVMEQK